MQVKCKICGNDINNKGLSLHLKTHSIKFEDYVLSNLKDFPQYKLCEICGKPTKWKNVCSIECGSRWKKIHWVGENSPRYGCVNTGDTNKKIAKSQKERILQNGHWAIGTHLSNKTKLKISNTRKRLKLGLGSSNGMFGKTHTPDTIEKIFKHRKMNKLEKLVADWLDSKNIQYTYQFFLNVDGVCKSYDFKLKDSNIIIEVHGDYWHGGSGVKKHVFNVTNNIENDKLKAEIAEKVGYIVIPLWEHDIKKNNYLDIYSKYAEIYTTR